MWNSVLMDEIQWLYNSRSSPTQLDDGQETPYRSWDFESHQQTNYADWSNKQDDATDELLQHHRHDSHNYPTAAELFRNFVGDESADRMEFYINHLTMEGCDANNISAALADSNGTSVDESSANDYRPSFPLLETIAEETTEELLLDSAAEGSDSPNSNSGRWGWGWGWLNTSDDDSSSVIHVPVDGTSSTAITSGSPTNQFQSDDLISEMYGHGVPDLELDVSNEDDVEEDEGAWSERDQEVPKKKRRIGSSLDEEDDEESTCSRSPSVTDSLIQFEALEKELDGGEEMSMVFRTSATALPFEDLAIQSSEVDPEVFLDCLEDCRSSPDKKSNLLAAVTESSSGHQSNGLEEFQRIEASGQQHSATRRSHTPPLRSWSSLPSLSQQKEDVDFLLIRRSRSAFFSSHSTTIVKTSGWNCVSQGQEADRQPLWDVTFAPASEARDQENMLHHEDEDEEDEAQWEEDEDPDHGFLNSDIEEYDTSGSNSDEDEEERVDRFDELGLSFVSSRSQRMRSFRSYGDSLNLLDTNDDGVLSHSASSSSSSSRSSPDRCSPEERHPSRSRHSVEALSEDSGYGDASGSSSLPIQPQSDQKDGRTLADQSAEEARLAGPSTPPATSLQLPSSLTICPPDGPPPSPTSQWLPEMEEANRGEKEDENWDQVAHESREKQTGKVSALLLRRQPRSRPAPLSLKEAEEFLINQQDDQPAPAEVPSARCVDDGAKGICIDLESKMSHTSNGNAAAAAAATNDDIRRPATDLEPSKFNPQIGMRDDVGPSRDDGGWEVPDFQATASTCRESTETATDHIRAALEKGEAEGEEKKKKDSLLHSTVAVVVGSDFIEPSALEDALPHNCSSLDRNVTCSPSILATTTASANMDSAFYPAPVVLKRYGPRQEVEVYISQQQLPCETNNSNNGTSRPLSPSSSSIRGVHFSPVVSSVNWRESYLNQSSSSEDERENDGSSSASSTNDRMLLQHSGGEIRAVDRVSPSVAQRVKVVESDPSSDVVVSSVVRPQQQDSGRNGNSGNSCPSTIHSATTTAAPSPSPPPPPPVAVEGGAPTTSANQSKKPTSSATNLFQRFSLSRLSARMSATFSRSESKRESGKKAADGPLPVTESVSNVALPTATSKSTNGKEKKTNKNKPAESTKHQPPLATNQKKMDDFKVVKEPRKRFFSRSPFQRSSSTPPTSSTQPEPAFEKSATTTQAAAAVVAAAASSSSNANSLRSSDSSNVDGSLGMRGVDQEPVTKQPMSTTLDDAKAAIDDSRTLSVVISSTVEDVGSSAKSTSTPPLPARKVQASHAKPPLPPQTKPRHQIQARKTYLSTTASSGEQQQQQQQHQQQQQSLAAAPPVPMVSSAGLQLALQHFKETARMERERLANSVPDLVAPTTPTPTPRPTSDYIDPIGHHQSGETAVAPAQPQPARSTSTTSTTTIIFPASRERARQAALSRASSVESAWNATASRAALNLSRRNIASSTANNNNNNSREGSDGPIQGHGPTKSRPVVPGLLETNLDCVQPVPANYSTNNYFYNYNNNNNNNASDETNLDELIQNLQLFCTTNNKRDVDYSTTSGQSVEAGSATTSTDKRFKSMLNLGSSSAPVSVQPDIDMLSCDPTSSSSSVRVADTTTNRAKSMEFLLDEDNKSTVQVPENQLKKCGERKMSEHELRIQRSLQKLNVPDWYKKNARSTTTATVDGSTNNNSHNNGSSSVTSTGLLLRRRDYGGSISSRHGGWGGLSASNRDAGTASSMTSLGSALSRAGTPTRVVIPTRVRPDWRNIKSSRESLTSPAAETCQSPSWNGSSSTGQQQPFPRWGSGRSSYSACPSPAPSTTSSSASTYRTSSLLNQHGRAPYLGWRSQERLNSSPAPLSIYQSPAERLASTLLAKTVTATSPAEIKDFPNKNGQEEHGQQQQQQEEDEGVRSSIRQVTSAIVHYVSESSDGDQPPESPASRNGFSRSPERHPLEALSRSPSPRRQRCVWVESSFIGGPGAESPSSQRQRGPTSPVRPESPPHHHRSSTTSNGGRPGPIYTTVSADRNEGPPSLLETDNTGLPPATLDDVLNSLLGLAPPSVHGPLRRPVSQPTIHNKQANRQQEQQHQQRQQQMQTIASSPSGLVFQETRSFNDLRSYNNSLQSK